MTRIAAELRTEHHAQTPSIPFIRTCLDDREKSAVLTALESSQVVRRSYGNSSTNLE
jgi:hypothetical protein